MAYDTFKKQRIAVQLVWNRLRTGSLIGPPETSTDAGRAMCSVAAFALSILGTLSKAEAKLPFRNYPIAMYRKRDGAKRRNQATSLDEETTFGFAFTCFKR